MKFTTILFIATVAVASTTPSTNNAYAAPAPPANNLPYASATPPANVVPYAAPSNPAAIIPGNNSPTPTDDCEEVTEDCEEYTEDCEEDNTPANNTPNGYYAPQLTPANTPAAVPPTVSAPPAASKPTVSMYVPNVQPAANNIQNTSGATGHLVGLVSCLAVAMLM